jgi:hypothetical protein
MHLHLASYFGMLDEPREGRDVGAKPEDDVWWTYPKEVRSLECMHGVKMFPKVVQANLTDLCQILGKPCSILSLLYFYKYQIKLFMFDALGCSS